MSVVAKIIYVSRKLSPGVSPGAQQLFLYDKNNNLLWVGTTAAITMAALNRRVWSATFEKGVASGETAPTFSDTTTASIRAIVRRQVDVTPSIEFTYDSREYTAFLTDYNGAHYEEGVFDYYIWTPYATDNTDMPTYNLAYVREVTNENSNWNVSRPVVSAETVSPGTAIDVVWSAPTPTPVDPNTSETIVSSTIYLEYSTNSNMTGATTVSLTGTSGTKSLTGLAKDRTYYFRVTGEWTSDDPDETSNEFSSASDISSATTITPLGTPVINSVAALDGEGSVSWGEITGAVSYLVALVDAENDVPTSSVSQGGTTWNFNESSGTTVQGKWVRVKAVATSNSIEYENSEWSEAMLIPDNRTPADEEPTTPVEQIMTRRIYKAIPYIDVPVEQIGGGGSSVKDAITVEYADAHYAAIGDAITPSTLPIATDDELGAIKVGSHLSIDSDTGVLSVSDNGSIASGNTGLVTGGTVYAETSKYAAFANKTLETSVKQNNANAVTGGAVYTFVTTVSNLPKAKAAGGADNAGVVYVTSASDKEGLIIDGTNAGQIKVDFATYSSWSSTVANKVANPSYVKQAIEGYVADATKVTATGGSSSYAGRIVKLNADGVIDESMLKVVSVTNFYEAASQAAMLALSSAQDGDICIRTDEHKTYILMSDGAANGYATLGNWKELTAPTGTVTSVNGKAGATVTLLATDIYAKSGTKISALTALTNGDTYALWTGSYTAEQISNATGSNLRVTSAQISDLFTSDSTDMPNFGDQGLAVDDTAVAAYVTSVVDDLDLGTAASADVSTQGVKDGDTGLVTGDQVYDYQPLLTRSKWTASQAVAGVYTGTATAPSSENYYIASAYAVKQWIDGAAYTLTKASKTALGGVYFPALDEVNRINGLSYDPSTGALGMLVANGTQIGTVFTNANSGISIANGVVSIAAATADYLGGVKVGTGNGLAYSSNKITMSLANGTSAGTVKASTGITISSGNISVNFSTSISTDASSDVKAATPKAVKTYVDGASYAIAAFTSGASGQGKVVKTQSSGGYAGYVSADLIPIDDVSIVNNNGALEVDINFVIDVVSSLGYLESAIAENTYLKRGVSGVAAWVQGNNYAVGDVVFNKGLLYRCIQTDNASTVIVTQGSLAKWEQITIFDLIPASRFDGSITGDGSTTEFTVTHNLGVKDVEVSLIDNSTDQEVFAAVTMYSATQVKIGFGAAPASGKVYRVVVRK